MNLAAMRVLGACGASRPDRRQQERLEATLREEADWAGFVDVTEAHGMGPLASLRLAKREAELPPEVRTGLAGLRLRHRKHARGLASVLVEVLDLLGGVGIEVMLLKGSALVHTVYPDAALRPRRDLDLLVPADRIDEGQALLQERLGFESRAPRVGRGHHHAPMLHTDRGGQAVGLELHRRVENRLRWDFAQLRPQAREVSIEGRPALVPAPLALLRHVYLHGFQLPFARAEGFRTLWLADLVQMLDAWEGELDWATLEAELPDLVAALPWIDAMTPLSEPVARRLPAWEPDPSDRVGQSDPLEPGPWYLAIRYGIPVGGSFAAARLRHGWERLGYRLLG